MSNLKTLRTRISSITSTRKITQAMKLVSASKLKKSRDAMEANRPYITEMNELATILVEQIHDKNQHPLLYGRPTEGIYNHLVIVLGSERGLCGSFNSSLAKEVKQNINILGSKGAKVQVLCIGAKIFALLKYTLNTTIDLLYSDSNKLAKNARTVATDLINKFKLEEFDICSIYYNSFVSVMARDIISKQILPLHTEINEEETVKFECEPEAELMIQELAHNFIVGNLTAMSFETTASEHGARMTSMDSATRNAGDMIDNLTTLYNRTRQAAVTTELTEIISGAESIKQ
jgi:F-type H+-transporting ATPase subunit gamma